MKLLEETGFNLPVPESLPGEGIDQGLGVIIGSLDRLVPFFGLTIGKHEFLKESLLPVKRPLHFHPVHENARPVPIGIDLPDVSLAVDHLVASLLDLEPKVTRTVQGLEPYLDHLVLMRGPVNLQGSQNPALVVHADEGP